MNDIQFAILARFAGRPGAPDLRDDNETVIALAGLIDKGLLRGAVQRDEIGRAVGATPVETTFDGLAALEEEELRRHDRRLRVRFVRRCRDGLFLAIGATFAAAASALFMRWIGPKPVCERPCECRPHDETAAQAPDVASPLVGEEEAVKADNPADND